MKRLRDWFFVMRLWSLTATTIPVLAGAALAAVHGSFSWVMLAITLVSGWTLHLAVNLLNTYGDYVAGVDTDAAIADSTELITGVFQPVEIFWAGVVSLVIGAALGLVAVVMSDWHLMWFAIAGVAGAGFYTTGLCYKFWGLGLPASFLLTGILMVGASYFAQACTLTWATLIVSFPVACQIAGILLGNDLRDMENDRNAGIRTMALIMGARPARALFYALHLLPYATIDRKSTRLNSSH